MKINYNENRLCVIKGNETEYGKAYNLIYLLFYRQNKTNNKLLKFNLIAKKQYFESRFKTLLNISFNNYLKNIVTFKFFKSRKENPQKLTQLSSRSHPRHLVGKRTAQKDITIDTTSDSQVNSNFPNRWSPASQHLTTIFTYFYIYI